MFATTSDNALSLTTTPSATTIRAWLLRLGYAHLTRPLSHSHNWAWLVDHTLQIGATKLLVIVGVQLDSVPFGVRSLQRSDLTLLAMVPMEQSNQERVDEELQKVVARTGVPRQIVADGASDLQQGIKRFQARHPQTAAVPDAAHFAANLLKHYWQNDPRWLTFTQRMTATASAIRQTKAAYLLAPKLRNKARYMSVGKFVRFGQIVLHKLRATTPEDELVRRYGWVSEYTAELAVWAKQYELVQVFLRQVRVEGLFARGVAELDAECARLGLSDNAMSVALRHRLRAYVIRHGRALSAGERLVGSSEVLESAFGVQKRLSGDQAESGLTMLSVGLGALMGETSPEQVRADMERVPEKAVQNWGKRTFGQTVQWLRRQFFHPASLPTNAVTVPG